MAKIYGLSAADRKLLRDDHRRQQAGNGSQRPVARRRRGPRGGGGGSTLTYCEATTDITAASGSAVGAGTVQPKKNDAGAIVNDGAQVDVVNLHQLEFSSGWRGYIDRGKSPPEVIVMTCVPA